MMNYPRIQFSSDYDFGKDNLSKTITWISSFLVRVDNKAYLEFNIDENTDIQGIKNISEFFFRNPKIRLNMIFSCGKILNKYAKELRLFTDEYRVVYNKLPDFDDVNNFYEWYDILQKSEDPNSNKIIEVVYKVNPTMIPDLFQNVMTNYYGVKDIVVDIIPDYSYQNWKEEDIINLTYIISTLFEYALQEENCKIGRPFLQLCDYISEVENYRECICPRTCVETRFYMNKDNNLSFCEFYQDKIYTNINQDPDFFFNYKDHPIDKEVLTQYWDRLEHCRDCRWIKACYGGCIMSNLSKENKPFDKFECIYRKKVNDNCWEILKHYMQENLITNKELSKILRESRLMEIKEWISD